MYQAPWLVSGLFVVELIHVLGVKAEERKVRVPLFLHYFTWLYILVAGLFIYAIHASYITILGPTHWLAPDRVEFMARDVMRLDGELNSTIPDPDDSSSMVSVFKYWQENGDLRNFPILVTFSLLSPVFTFATILVCGYHTWTHVSHIAKKQAATGEQGAFAGSYLRRTTIIILALPAVYGLMSFKSVIRCWELSTNFQHPDGFKMSGILERHELLDQMYEANFMVGDIYETIALVCFGKIVMTVLEREILRARAEQDTDTVKDLVCAMTKLTVGGVRLFCLACVSQGMYILIVTTMALDFPAVLTSIFNRDLDNPGVMQTPVMKAKCANFFLGFGFAASGAAINNIMVVERDFHKWLEEFGPNEKFWCTKILVTLAFMQSIALKCIPPFSTWTSLYVNLLYASMLSMECFAISLMHLKAWGANEKFFRDEDQHPNNVRLLRTRA